MQRPYSGGNWPLLRPPYRLLGRLHAVFGGDVLEFLGGHLGAPFEEFLDVWRREREEQRRGLPTVVGLGVNGAPGDRMAGPCRGVDALVADPAFDRAADDVEDLLFVVMDVGRDRLAGRQIEIEGKKAPSLSALLTRRVISIPKTLPSNPSPGSSSEPVIVP